MATSNRKGLLSSQNCSSPHWPHRLELLEPPRQGQPLLTQQGHVFFPPWLLRLSGHSQPVLLKVHKSIWSDRNKRGEKTSFFSISALLRSSILHRLVTKVGRSFCFNKFVQNQRHKSACMPYKYGSSFRCRKYTWSYTSLDVGPQELGVAEAEDETTNEHHVDLSCLHRYHNSFFTLTLYHRNQQHLKNAENPCE